MTTTRKRRTTSAGKTPRRKATTRKKSASGKSGKGRSDATRTSSRSAKRRSPKPDTSVEDEIKEIERVEFLQAMDRYKRKTGKTFPSWTEVLEVIRSLGWTHPKSAEKLAGNSRKPAKS